MEPFGAITATAVPLDMANVNTDQIFPARFIRKPRAVGYAQFTFHDVRRSEDGSLRPDFPLNEDRYRDARIIVGGTNFGCGSSREGAVYTLIDSDFRALIAPSFGDIFAANCLKNGVLTVTLPSDVVAGLRAHLREADRPVLTIDLEAESIVRPDGTSLGFSADPFQKHCLLNGLNEIDLSLEFAAEMAAFEAAYRERFPWLASGTEPKRR
ncbi:MAG: 3-isopropylmalate dehydratase small subunit [Alphaproteobacteria bacterium]|nr:3-isopropylmalate dehydratase small subunit [Alphaproteobacteria bacterium]